MEQKYVDLLSDTGFKAVFEDERNKDVVMDFLNAVLPGERVVQDITYRNGEIAGKSLTSKGVRFDLLCRDLDGTAFVVEMQRSRNCDGFFERSVYYGSRVYENQLPTGSHSYKSPPVYVIGIMEDKLEENCADSQQVIALYQFTEKYSGRIARPTITCIFVQLGNFTLTEDECRNDFERWCFSIKNSHKLSEKPASFGEKPFGRLFYACEIAKFDKTKRLRYNDDMMSEVDYNSGLYNAEQRGLALGMEKGIAQVAANMKAQGYSAETINGITGLSIKEIEAL